jgi:hypothetical protein
MLHSLIMSVRCHPPLPNSGQMYLMSEVEKIRKFGLFVACWSN